MKEKISIGLLGFGVVAQGLVHVLKQTQGDRISIKKICVKDLNKARSLPGYLFTDDEDELLRDQGINLIVELIDDAEASYRIVKKSLQAGKQTVSANKKMLAGHLDELILLQKEHNVSLLYEPSSCGSIPIIRNLEEYYDNDLLQSITGILNGSSNYILSKMSGPGIDYADALLKAQELGFAESDPTLDVEGIDALNKLVIITVHAFSLYVSPINVFSFGISKISAQNIRFAKEKGRKIKLVGQVRKNPDNTLSMYVIPRMVSPEKYIYNFEEIRERYFSGDFKYVTGLITLENLRRIKNELSDSNVFIAEI